MSRLVVITAFDGVTLIDVAAPADVFHVAAMAPAPKNIRPYDIKVASIDGGMVKSLSGLAIDTVPLHTLHAEEIDTIIVPGGGPPHNPPVPDSLVDWLRHNAPGIRRVCGICTGTFLLAKAGLIRGKAVTTHWQSAALFKEKYSDSVINVDSIFVRDGHIWTSAGFSTGTDLALALIEEDDGYETAVQLAKTMVVFHKRSGSQSQFSAPLAFQEKSDSRFSRLHAWILEHLTDNLTVERLAEQANMSVRTFVRRYKESIGCTPTKTVEMLKLEFACDRLATTGDPIKQIARVSGFGNQQNMRRAFMRSLDMTPLKYRESHRHQSCTRIGGI